MARGGAIQGPHAWGKSPAMPPSRLQPLYPNRRRRSPARFILPILLILLIGFIFYLSTVDTEVPVTQMEQDVTDALPKS